MSNKDLLIKLFQGEELTRDEKDKVLEYVYGSELENDIIAILAGRKNDIRKQINGS